MITLSTGSIYYYGLERIFKVAATAGFQGLELMFRPYGEAGHFEYWSLNNLKELQDKYKLPIHSLHVPPHFEDTPKDYYLDMIDIGQKLMVNNRIVFHIPDRRYLSYGKWFKGMINNGLDKYLIENIGAENSIENINIANYPNFCFDVTHSMVTSEDPLATAEGMDNIKQFHLSYFNGKDNHRNVLESPELIKNIVKTHPEATRCLEVYPNAFPDITNENEVIEILTKTREFLEEI